MKIYLLIILLTCLSLFSFGQTAKKPVDMAYTNCLSINNIEEFGIFIYMKIQTEEQQSNHALKLEAEGKVNLKTTKSSGSFKYYSR